MWSAGGVPPPSSSSVTCSSVRTNISRPSRPAPAPPAPPAPSRSPPPPPLRAEAFPTERQQLPAGQVLARAVAVSNFEEPDLDRLMQEQLARIRGAWNQEDSSSFTSTSSITITSVLSSEVL